MTDLQEQMKQLKELGYAIVPNALSAEGVATARAAVEDVLDREANVAVGTGTQTDNLRNAHVIVGKHPHFYEFFLNPPVITVVKELLESTAGLDDPWCLRSRVEDDGYLCFRELVDSDWAIRVKREIMALMMESGF